MLKLMRHGYSIPRNIEMSRMEELGEIVKGLSQKVETLLDESIMLYEKSEESDISVVRLIGYYKEMVRRVNALDERCSYLEQELDLRNLHLDTLSMTTSLEEKGLNSDSFIGKTLQIQMPHFSSLYELTMDEFAVAGYEPTAVMEGALQSEPQHQSVPSYNMKAQLEPIATVPANQKRKAQEMLQRRQGTSSLPSSSYSSPITFLNTFSDEVPRKRQTRNPVRRAGRPNAITPLTLPLEEPPQEQQVQEAQSRVEELQVPEEEHAEPINVLFESTGETFDFGCGDSEYDWFRTGN